MKKADLWEALREYPEAKRMLVHKGREILLKDGLLNEDAPLEEKSPEQWNQELREQIDRLLDKWVESNNIYLTMSRRHPPPQTTPLSIQMTPPLPSRIF